MPIAPPRPKGPPLNALRAFEAAARLGGFAAAAEELCVTPGAVAQHIKALEAWVGAPLFERRSQGVRLTPLGSGVLEEFSGAFDRLGAAVQMLRGRAAPEIVHIAALPSVAQLWLSPKMPALRQALPGVAISITALEARPNLLREPFDLSLFFANSEAAKTQISLAQDTIFPVCAPAIAAEINQISDLTGIPLLHDAIWRGDWDLWIRSVEPRHSLDTRGPVFSLYSLAVQEAENGAGVLMGHGPLVQDRLRTGRLVAPFSHRVPLQRHLVLDCARPGDQHQVLGKVIAALQST